MLKKTAGTLAAILGFPGAKAEKESSAEPNIRPFKNTQVNETTSENNPIPQEIKIVQTDVPSVVKFAENPVTMQVTYDHVIPSMYGPGVEWANVATTNQKQIDDLKKRIEVLQKEVEDKQKESILYLEARDRAAQSRDNANAMLSARVKILDEKTLKLAELEKQLEVSLRLVNEKTLKLAELENQLSVQKKLTETEQLRLAAAHDREVDWQNRLGDMQKKVNAADLAVEREKTLQNQLEDMQGQVKRAIESREKATQMAHADAERLAHTINDQRKTIDDLTVRVVKSQEEINGLKDQVPTQKETIAKLTRELQQTKDGVANTIMDLQKKLKEQELKTKTREEERDLYLKENKELRDKLAGQQPVDNENTRTQEENDARRAAEQAQFIADISRICATA